MFAVGIVLMLFGWEMGWAVDMSGYVGRDGVVEHCRAFFPGFPETTAPELISSSILGSRSDKPDQFDHTTTDFQNTLQTLGLTWFLVVSQPRLESHFLHLPFYEVLAERISSASA